MINWIVPSCLVLILIIRRELKRRSFNCDLPRNMLVAKLGHELSTILDKLNGKFRLPFSSFIDDERHYLTTFCDEKVTFNR